MPDLKMGLPLIKSDKPKSIYSITDPVEFEQRLLEEDRDSWKMDSGTEIEDLGSDQGWIEGVEKRNKESWWGKRKEFLDKIPKAPERDFDMPSPYGPENMYQPEPLSRSQYESAAKRLADMGIDFSNVPGAVKAIAEAIANRTMVTDEEIGGMFARIAHGTLGGIPLAGMIGGGGAIKQAVLASGARTMKQLEKTHPHIAKLIKDRKMAIKYEKAGKSDDFIFEKLGMSREPGSGKFMFEFSDRNMKMKKSMDEIVEMAGKEGHLNIRDIMEHPEFEKYYGFLLDAMDDAGIKLKINESSSAAPRIALEYGDKTKAMELGLLYETSKTQVEIKTIEQLRKTLLHEMQHVVQGFESFFRGGSPQEFKQFWVELLTKRGLSGEDLEDHAISAARLYYKRFQGEIMARATAERADLNMEWRKKLKFWESDPEKSKYTQKKVIKLSEGDQAQMSHMFEKKFMREDYLNELDPNLVAMGVTDVYLPRNSDEMFMSVKGTKDKEKFREWIKRTTTVADESSHFKISLDTKQGKGWVIQGFDPKKKEWNKIIKVKDRDNAARAIAQWNDRKRAGQPLPVAKRVEVLEEMGIEPTILDDSVGMHDEPSFRKSVEATRKQKLSHEQRKALHPGEGGKELPRLEGAVKKVREKHPKRIQDILRDARRTGNKLKEAKVLKWMKKYGYEE